MPTIIFCTQLILALKVRISYIIDEHIGILSGICPHPSFYFAQVVKQTAQNALGCSLLSFDPVYFTFDEELLQFEPVGWKQDGWEVVATKPTQVI